MVKFPTKEEVEIKTTKEILEKGAKKSQTEAEKTAKLAGIEEKVKLAQAQVAEITAGVSALAEVDTDLAPVIDTNAGDIGAVGAGLTAADTQMQTLIETLTKQSEEAAKRATTAQKGLLAAITTRKDVKPLDTKQLTIDVLAEYGLTPESVQKVQSWMGQLTAYNQQVANLEANKQAALNLIEQKPILQGIIDIEKARQAKVYNLEISAKAAQAGVVAQQIQMERGLWTDARSTASMIVNAATYDQQQKVADLDWAMDTYKDLYDMATTEEQTAWNRAYTVTQNELTKSQDDWKEKLDLNQRAAEAGVSLGWDSTYMESHTVEELNAEYAERVAVVPDVTTQIIGSAEAGYQTVTIDKKTGKVIRTEPIGKLGVPDIPGVIVTIDDPELKATVAIDISSVSGLERYRELGGERTTAKAELDVNTEWNVSTIDDMLDRVYGLEPATSVAGQKQETKKDLVEMSKRDVTKDEAKQYILDSGFNPDDEEWDSFLNLWPGVGRKAIQWWKEEIVSRLPFVKGGVSRVPFVK